MRSISCVASLLVMTTALARADQTKLEASAQAMNLTQLVKIAVRTAPQLARAGFDLARADAAVMTARSAENFRLEARADLFRLRGEPAPNTAQRGDSDVKSVTVAIGRLLPTNGLLELFGTTSRDSIALEPAQSGVGIRLNQPLLGGFGLAAQRKVILQTRHQREAAELQLQAAALSYTGELAAAYWRLALAWRVLEVRRATLELTTKQRKLTEAAMRTGKLAGSEAIPIDAAIANSEQAILAAELEVVLRSLEVRQLAGLELPPDQLAIKPERMPEVEPEQLDLAENIKLGLDASPELAAARAALRGGEALEAGTRRDLLPRLDLQLEAGPRGAASTFSSSVDALVSREGSSITGSLNLAWPIGRDLARGAHLDAQATRASLRATVIELQTSVGAAIARTVYEIRTHQARTALGRKVVELARANVEAEQRKFELGKSTNNEIVRLQGELELARLGHAEAHTEYLIARAKLDAQTGVLLGKFGVKVTSKYDVSRGAPRRKHP